MPAEQNDAADRSALTLLAPVDKLAVTSRAKACLPSLLDATWQRITEVRGKVAMWQSDKRAAGGSPLRNSVKLLLQSRP